MSAAFTSWRLWSDTSGQRNVPPEKKPPTRPPRGGSIELSADGLWLTVYAPRTIEGETRDVPIEVYVRGREPRKRRR